MTSIDPVRRRLLLGAGAAWLAGCSRGGVRGQPLAPDAGLLCLGDSLTAGVGARPDEAYPQRLAALTGRAVHNGGVSGNTAEDALARLPELLAETSPGLVLVSIGGNDFLRGLPVETTRAALRSIVEQARAGAQVALLAQPEPSALTAAIGALRDHPLYAQLAEELSLPLFSGGWAEVLSRAELRADRIHANARGYELFTERLTAWLREARFIA